MVRINKVSFFFHATYYRMHSKGLKYSTMPNPKHRSARPRLLQLIDDLVRARNMSPAKSFFTDVKVEKVLEDFEFTLK